MKSNHPYKVCPKCGNKWNSLEELLEDRNLRIEGYQASFDDSREGLFLFTHAIKNCYSTFSVRTGDLEYLYTGPKYTIHYAFTDKCEQRCPNNKDFENCSVDCDMRWAREILSKLRSRDLKTKNHK